MTAILLPLLLLGGAGTWRWWSDRPTTATIPVSAGRGWDAQRAAAPDSVAPHIRAATEYAEWTKKAASKLTADSNLTWYSSAVATTDLRDLAAEYPDDSSPVSATLSRAAAHLVNAEVALSQKEWSVARTELEAVAAVLEPLPSQVTHDLENLEDATGVLVQTDGVVDVGVTRQGATVREWLDGDTVQTDDGIIDLIGIDAAERDGCDRGEDARDYANYLAPQGTAVNVLHPNAVDARGPSGHTLAYLELLDGTDLGYSLLLSKLAVARFDSLDGYQWHPRQVDYRKASGAMANLPVGCSGDPATTFAKASSSDGDDNGERHVGVRSLLQAAVRGTAHFTDWIPTAMAAAHDGEDYVAPEDSDGENQAPKGGHGGPVDVPDWLCPTKFC